MESPFAVPESWHRHRHPRRGSTGVTRFVPDPQARAVVEAEIAGRPGHVRAVLGSPTTGKETAIEAMSWLTGQPDGTPLGAAAVAAVVIAGNWRHHERMAVLADLLIAKHGLRFAAEAAVLLNALVVTDDNPPPQQFPPLKGNPGVRLLRSGENRQGWHLHTSLQVALRVRRALATAGDAEHDEVVEALLPYRGAHPYARVATSVLIPSRTDWVEEDVASAVADADSYRAAALTTAAGTGAQLDALAPVANGWIVVGSTAMVTTIVDGAGPAAAPALFHWLDQGLGDADAQKRLLAALAVIPGDDVLGGLIKRVDRKYVVAALTEAAERFPEPALRLFAEHAAKRPIADLLRGHVLTHTDLIEQVTPRLSAAAAALVRQIAEEARSLVIAPAEAIPPLLTTPPWLRRAKTAKPVVIKGLACTDAPGLRWLAGEREQWAQTAPPRDGKTIRWAGTAERLLTGRGRWNDAARFFTGAPADVARPVLLKWRARSSWEVGPWMRATVTRFELDALPVLLDLAGRSATTDTAELLMPFAAPEVATLMAGWLTRLKSLRRHALAWLLRHPAEAASALIPAALGPAGVARRQAETALLALHKNGHGEPVRAAAHRYGPVAAAAVDTLLATDPLAMLPAKMPPLPGWAVPGLLPPVRLRDGSGALPPDSIGHLVTVLALSRLDSPYPGLEIVRQSCDPDDLAEFAWGVFHRWRSAGAEAKDNWALDALGLLGNDDTVRRLTPLILTWPGDGGHQKAVTGLTVLSAIGTDVALMHLHGVAQRAKFKGLKTTAQTRMAEVAESLGLTADQLADRLVPDLGLSADGSLRLDYGPRQFVVGFDEQLRPFVTDTTGKRLKSLPKPGARDDADLAPAAWKQFTTLKKDARTIAADQVRRLEQAMVRGRRWSVTDFQRFFIDHPLVWHISRRLVWALYDGPDLRTPFRIAEDRTCSTVDDEPLPLPGAAPAAPPSTVPAASPGAAPAASPGAASAASPGAVLAALPSAAPAASPGAVSAASSGAVPAASPGAVSAALTGVASAALTGVASATLTGVASAALTGVASAALTGVASAALTGVASAALTGVASATLTGVASATLTGVASATLTGVASGAVTVGVAHPLQLGEDVAVWAELFGDYEILQPFPQLSRPVFTLTPAEAAGSNLSRFEGLTLPTTTILGLERRGWRREDPQDAGMQGRMELAIAPGLGFALDIEPGIAIGSIDYFPEQKVTNAFLHNGTGARWRRNAAGETALSNLDPVAASELLRDLTDLSA
ncbi:DUF4132 domain-containing protein [Actinoplanes sp. DH11]|uniref:DUF4132 domain-containing protein n=1 Tax=Actinoplanes sp. DH11 TaxID=2857011 RepID=UPI001E5FEB9E|nr:DUF4132 domain-containing protein [Actinoplanes sp. DH11]